MAGHTPDLYFVQAANPVAASAIRPKLSIRVNLYNILISCQVNKGGKSV